MGFRSSWSCAVLHRRGAD